ncbi:MAG: SdpI family protein, partial [Chitinophagaceae bacterium]|nr:SdpI family protein [Chitinophagaceae bacterium]
MDSKNNIRHILAIIACIVPLFYLAYVWDMLPVDHTPLHFGADGKPDRYGNRIGVIIPVAVVSIVSIFTYLLMVNIHKIDPKRTKEGKSPKFDTIGGGIVLFMMALNLVIIMNTVNPETNYLDKAVMPLLGLLFAFLGNMMYNIKPNYFAGVRIAWTLADDENWKKTHRLTGGLWFLGGIGIAVTALLVSGKSV